ncbi:hypothetical protein AM233_22705 [Bacillus sp. FJAT-22058]|nr:hypothetical protein AM233_22705 [Bacillus sp. FJAT-22058]
MIVDGIIKKCLREGQYFKKMLSFLNDSKYYSYNELENYQNERLKKIIEHSYKNVPYYNRVFNSIKLKPEDIKSKEDLWKIPVLTKNDVKKNFNDLKAKNIPKLFMNIGKTSGTTGTPAQFYRDLYSINFENAIVWRQWLSSGVKRNSKIAIIRGNNIIPNNQLLPPFWKIDKIQKHIEFSSFHMSEENLEHYINKIKEYSPEALQSYPSTAYILAKKLDKLNEQINLKSVFTSSEPIYSYQRELIEKVFGCKIWDYYGMAERVISATECSAHNGLHINEEYGITEFISNNVISPKEGIMVGTSLQNFGMPLIRYVTNDYGKLQENLCTCGMQHRLIYPIETKEEDMIITKDGRWISPSIITHAFKAIVNVSKSQVVQHDYDKFEVLLVPEVGFSKNEKLKLLEGLKERFGNSSSITINLVDDIPRTKNGKFRWIISHVDGEYTNEGS